MNEKIAHQIEKMKKQTIGVEVEMNNIKRDKAARLAADFFGTGRYENTASRNGYMTWSAWMSRAENGNFKRMSALPEMMPTNAKWLHRFLNTKIWKPCRN